MTSNIRSNWIWKWTLVGISVFFSTKSKYKSCPIFEWLPEPKQAVETWALSHAKIREMLLKLEVLKYATSLDLNMVYYYICLSEEESNLCTIILTQVNYRYKRLPMGVINSLEKFQEKINEMFCIFECIRA